MFWKNVRNALRATRVRLTLLFAVLFTTLAATVFILVYWHLSSALVSHMDRTLRNDVDEMLGVYRKRGPDALRAYCNEKVADEGSQNIFCRFIPRNEGAAQATTTNAGYRTMTVPGEADHVRVVSILLSGSEVLQIGRPLRHEERLVKDYARVFLGAFSVVLACGILLGWLIAHKTTAGMRRLAAAANRIRTEGDMSFRVPARSESTETEQLAAAFNGMLDRIQALVTELREVSDNIAHDLRSPVTRMRGMAETTLSGAQRLDEYRDMAGIIVEQCDRLDGMIGTMLEIAATEAGTLRISTADIDIAALVGDVHDLFGPVAEDKGVRLLIEGINEPIPTRGDPRRLQRVVTNLVDNAIKYTPSGGTVTITMARVAGAVQIAVCDTGCGIEPDDLPRVFDRYYRADRSRTTAGSGLGLSLARAFARAHGGDITVSSTIGKGSVFTLALPT